ncbi:MAG TPA: hypothetical protein VK851_14530 [Anaerolineales bacterium]|nr:hypothetical protein [Anaerolineales bacterium]
MDYGLIGKVEKAKRYAEQRDRFRFTSFELNFHGDNNDHKISFQDDKFQCDCEFFLTHERCAHSMALDEILKDMMP